MGLLLLPDIPVLLSKPMTQGHPRAALKAGAVGMLAVTLLLSLRSFPVCSLLSFLLRLLLSLFQHMQELPHGRWLLFNHHLWAGGTPCAMVCCRGICTAQECSVLTQQAKSVQSCAVHRCLLSSAVLQTARLAFAGLAVRCSGDSFSAASFPSSLAL